jgi:small-conductance mechanosensitive channel
MPKTSIEFDEEGFKAYKELVQYLEAKYGKARGLIGREVGKAIMLYLQQLKASKGSPQVAQQKPATKTEEPMEHAKTAQSIEQEIKDFRKRTESLEDLKQKVEDLNKEVKTTKDTLMNIYNVLNRLPYMHESLIATIYNLYYSIIDRGLPKEIAMRKNEEERERLLKIINALNADIGRFNRILEEIIQGPPPGWRTAVRKDQHSLFEGKTASNRVLPTIS